MSMGSTASMPYVSLFNMGNNAILYPGELLLELSRKQACSFSLRKGKEVSGVGRRKGQREHEDGAQGYFSQAEQSAQNWSPVSHFPS